MTKTSKTSRNITPKTRLILYTEAAGQCSMYQCNEKIIFNTSDGKSQYGNIAHIEALNENGARFNPNLSLEERNSEDNLILLCSNCHKKIDDDPKKYTVEYLKKMKKEHILKMELLMENSNVNFNYDDLFIASKNIINKDFLLTPSNNEYLGEDYTRVELDYKMNKNELTSISKNNINLGLIQLNMVKEFFVYMSKDDELFVEKVKYSLEDCYDLLKDEFSGDSLFLAIYENFNKGLTENQQSACLSIIVYFFSICELFEK